MSEEKPRRTQKVKRNERTEKKFVAWKRCMDALQDCPKDDLKSVLHSLMIFWEVR